MNIRFVLSMFALSAALIIVLMLNRQNTAIAAGDPQTNFLNFNRSPTDTAANRIMDLWRQDPVRTSAVKKLLLIDYVFMVLYSLCLCISLYQRGRITDQRPWLRSWLKAGIFLVLLCTLVDATQDYKIYSYISSSGWVYSLKGYTRIKFIALALGVIPLIISFFPRRFFSAATLGKALRDLSGLLGAVWVFFPSLLFIFFTIFCFWLAGQGKDIIVAFTEKRSDSLLPPDAIRIVFFLAIGFWVYVTWYSSRVIAYIKDKRQQGDTFFDIGSNFLDVFPRLAGNACFLVLELSVLQVPILSSPLTSTESFLLLFLALINLYFIDRWIWEKWSRKTGFRTLFWVAFITFWILLPAAVLLSSSRAQYIYCLFGLLLFFHGVFILYVNLRRVDMEINMAKRNADASGKAPAAKKLFEKIMDYFCIPVKESGYFIWFLRFCMAGVVIYLAAIIFLGIARAIGPFPLLILAFSVLLAFGNIVAAFSVKYRINFHFLLLLMAFFIGLTDTHSVRTVDLKGVGNHYKDRPALETYLKAWLDQRVSPTDTTLYDMYFILANGGASRSGYWTASVLGKLEDASLGSPSGRFSDHLFCLSGTSGGGVGVATFFSLLRNRQIQTGRSYTSSAAGFLQQDYFTYTIARMLGPDFFSYIFHFKWYKDRAAALEGSFEESARVPDTSRYQVPFYDNFSTFRALGDDNKIALPILFVNTTRMQDGNPGVVTNLKLDSGLFNNRVDVLGLLGPDQDISMASGAILGARFPYLSPAGGIANNYFVDGGYFDNSGAGVVQETLRGILNLMKDSSQSQSVLYRQLHRLHIKILHIVNSPVDLDSMNLRPVPPIKNDLFAPVLTIVGAYDMQTTVNDNRLHNYVKDIRKYSGVVAEDTLISLYKEYSERPKDTLHRRFDKEPAYSMNWFMSDTTRRRIDERLEEQPVLKYLITRVRQ